MIIVDEVTGPRKYAISLGKWGNRSPPCMGLRGSNFLAFWFRRSEPGRVSSSTSTFFDSERQ